jgi:hypothetical protein
LITIFKHVDVIITADLDLKGIQGDLLKLDKEVGYMKSIVLMRRKDLEDLQTLVSTSPKIKFGSTDDMSIHESLIGELTTFCNFDRKEIEELYKGKEEENMSEKIKLLLEWNKNKDKEENKEEKKEEEESKEEVHKKLKEETDLQDIDENLPITEDNQSKILNQYLEDDPELDEVDKNPYRIFGLDTNKTLQDNIKELANYADNNYNANIKPKTYSKGELFSKVYNINPNSIYSDYLKTLHSLYKHLCRKTLVSFFSHMEITNILNTITYSSQNLSKFLKFFTIRVNEAVNVKLHSNNQYVYDNFIDILEKLIPACYKNDKFRIIIEIIYEKLIVKQTRKILLKSIKDKKNNIRSVFTTETLASEYLNVHLIPEILKIYIKKAPDVVFKNETEFMNLMTVLLLIPMVFRGEKEYHKNVYMCIHKIINQIAKNPKRYGRKIKEDLMKLKQFKMMIEKCNFDVTVSSGVNLTNEQKLLFEIFLLLRKVDCNMEDFSSIYSYTDILLEMEKNKLILREAKKFDFISYLIYFERELSHGQKMLKIYEETSHSMFEANISAGLTYSGFKKMMLKIDPESLIDPNSAIAISSDPEGHNILNKIDQKMISEESTITWIYTNTCYIHYPFNPPKIIAFGENTDYKLGNGNTNTTADPIEMNDFYQSIKMLKARRNYTIALGTDDNLYYSGYKTSLTNYHYTMTKYEKKMPDERIVSLEAGSCNIVCLTTANKLYIEGTDTEFHIRK